MFWVNCYAAVLLNVCLSQGQCMVVRTFPRMRAARNSTGRQPGLPWTHQPMQAQSTTTSCALLPTRSATAVRGTVNWKSELGAISLCTSAHVRHLLAVRTGITHWKNQETDDFMAMVSVPSSWLLERGQTGFMHALCCLCTKAAGGTSNSFVTASHLVLKSASVSNAL